MFSYKSLASGAFVWGIIFFADNDPWTCDTDVINILLHIS